MARAYATSLPCSTRCDDYRLDFFRAQLLSWVLTATDGHAKNLSLFIGRGGTYRMTPLYDVVSAWPVAGTAAGQLPWRKLKLAMALRAGNAHYHLAEIQRRQWNAVARRLGLGMDFVHALSQKIKRFEVAIGRNYHSNRPYPALQSPSWLLVAPPKLTPNCCPA